MGEGARRARMSTTMVSLSKVGTQIGWSLSSRVAAAVLQLVSLLLLARLVSATGFGFYASVYVALQTVVAVNGFGLNRTIQYTRALDPADERLAALARIRTSFTYLSAAGWALACVVLGIVLDSSRLLGAAFLAVWLVAEQITAVWNAISLVDGRARDLMGSYLARRVPVVVVLAFAFLAPELAGQAWILGMCLGSVLALLLGLGRQERWARPQLGLAWRMPPGMKIGFGFWFSQIGLQLRDLDVLVLTSFNALAGGLYALPARFVNPMNMVVQAVVAVAFPRLARRRHVSGRDLTMFVAVASLPTWVACALVAACASLLPTIAGADYAAAVPVLRLLMLAAAICAPSLLITVYLQSRPKGSGLAGFAHFFAGIAQIVAVGALGSQLGLDAAAYGAVAAQIALLIVLALGAGIAVRGSKPGVAASADGDSPAG